MREITRTEAREKAREAATPLNKPIQPSDIDDSANSWDDIEMETLENECVRSAEIILAEEQMPFAGICHDLAMTSWTESMPRISMSHLDYEDMETAVVEANVWPNEMNKWEIREILEENYRSNDDMSVIYHECYNDAYDVVLDGIVDGMQSNMVLW